MFIQRFGITAGREFIALFAPQLLLNKDLKKYYKQKFKDIWDAPDVRPAETEADSELRQIIEGS